MYNYTYIKYIYAYTYMYVMINKGSRNLKERKEQYMIWEAWREERKGKMMSL